MRIAIAKNFLIKFSVIHIFCVNIDWLPPLELFSTLLLFNIAAQPMIAVAADDTSQTSSSAGDKSTRFVMEMVGAIIDDNYDAERRQKSTQLNPPTTSENVVRDQDVEAVQSIKINSSMWTRDVLWFLFLFQFSSSFYPPIFNNRWQRGAARLSEDKE